MFSRFLPQLQHLAARRFSSAGESRAGAAAVVEQRPLQCGELLLIGRLPADQGGQLAVRDWYSSVRPGRRPAATTWPCRTGTFATTPSICAKTSRRSGRLQLAAGGDLEVGLHDRQRRDRCRMSSASASSVFGRAPAAKHPGRLAERFQTGSRNRLLWSIAFASACRRAGRRAALRVRSDSLARASRSCSTMIAPSGAGRCVRWRSVSRGDAARAAAPRSAGRATDRRTAAAAARSAAAVGSRPLAPERFARLQDGRGQRRQLLHFGRPPIDRIEAADRLDPALAAVGEGRATRDRTRSAADLR